MQLKRPLEILITAIALTFTLSLLAVLDGMPIASTPTPNEAFHLAMLRFVVNANH
jgi:hypothetical protein